MAVRGLPRWWARWGVRTRSAVAAFLVLAAALALAAVALLWLLQSSLQSAADGAAGARADQLSARLLSDPLTAIDPTLLATDGRTTVIQVIDAAGRVVLASAGAPGTPLTGVVPGPGDQVSVGRVNNTTTGGDYRVTVQGVSGARGAYTVVVGAAQDPIDATLATVTTLLAVGFPVIAVVGGAALSALVGRSLRPVERMRAQVSAVTTADLSERVEVPAARDEISRLAQTMNAMLARIEAGHAAQRRFVGDASHELRSPLATVTTALELATTRPGVLAPTVVERTLLPEAHRMQQLVEDLLLLARADERGLPLHLTDVDLDDVLDTEARRLRAAAAVRVECTVHPVRVLGDAPQLGRVVRNLADNAARHATAVVSLTATVQGGTAVVVVSDDGPGVPPADHERIFQRFVRLDTDRSRAAGGSGLGLAIVAEIVAAHGGTVGVESGGGESGGGVSGGGESGAGGGARFVLRLPVAGPVQPPSGSSR
jgi:two-component system OmpR family sensor kinase